MIRINTLFVLVYTFCFFEKSYQCSQQYKRELRYLDFYLGIVPTKDDGKLQINANSKNQYVHSAQDLNCRFDDDCAWDNVASDDLLDTSDFYLFEKKDDKTFPVQLRPGSPHPAKGTHFILAGNTTQNPQSAVLASFPIACQVSKGRLKLKYWLYNAARIEVIILKLNPTHGHLQVRSRPKTDCSFLKPTEHECVVEVDEMHEPFKIGIRAFQLHDSGVGSLALITDIQYEAQVCRENEVPSLFGGIPLSASEPAMKQINTASDLNCASKVGTCLWSPVYSTGAENTASLRSLWQTGSNQRLWNEFVPTAENTHPENEFIFQYIDPMSTLPLGKLQSAFVPCTSTSSSLQFKYWMSSNVQAQVCIVTHNNVSLSCVFLNEAASPGPVVIDIDRGDKNAFRFVIDVIKFDPARASIFAIDDVKFTGRLCHEKAPETTPTPLGIGTLFELQPFPHLPLTNGLPASLACNYEVEECSHWENDDDSFQSGFVPAKLPFKMPKSMRGNVAVALFNQPESYAILQSPVISCAENARITVFYFSSLGARLSICADDKCLKEKNREASLEKESEDTFGHAGELSVNITTTNNFRLRIIAESVNEDNSGFAESFVIIKKITTEGHVCRMKDNTELACEHLFCDFKNGTLCNYNTALTTPDDVPFQHDLRNGIQATLTTTGRRRVVLRSPEFQLSRSAELRFRILLSTFGSVAYMCPDEFVDSLVEDCELLLGPKIDQKRFEVLQVQLDPEIHHFAIIAFHDKYQQFGEADVAISDINLVDTNGQALCFVN